ncbi:MAG: hypothetical protein RL560_953 [Actinomycetota bacterium]
MRLNPRKGITAIACLTIAITTISTETSFSAVKGGSACTKAGQTAISSGKKFTCNKIGKKLQWDKGILIPAKAMPSPTSPESSKELSGHEKVVKQVEDLWIKWRSKSTSTFTPVKMILQPGYDSKWNDASKHSNILIASFVGNGHNLIQEPISVFGDTEEWLSATGRPIACGRSVPEQPLGIYCGHIQLGYGYFVLNASQGEKFVDKPLTQAQARTVDYMVAHDVATMYELQAQYGAIAYDGVKDQIPAWIREGFVQLFAALAIADSNAEKKNYSDYFISTNLIESFPKGLCSKTLQDFESKDRNWGGSCASSQNFYAVELLAARHGGFDALFKFVTLYGVSNDWTASFKTAFGISREDFYTEWYDYLNIPQGNRPALSPAAQRRMRDLNPR